MVQMMSMIANVNWETTRIFRGVTKAFIFLKAPFKTAAGLKADKKNAG